MKKTILWFVMAVAMSVTSCCEVATASDVAPVVKEVVGTVAPVVKQVTQATAEMPSMKELINIALAELVTSFVAVKDFAFEQIPLILIELLRWKFAISMLCFLGGLLTLIGILYILIKWGKSMYREDFDVSVEMDGLPRPIALLFGVLTTIWAPATLWSVGNPFAWLQIWIAPRVYLIEYAAELVK